MLKKKLPRGPTTPFRGQDGHMPQLEPFDLVICPPWPLLVSRKSSLSAKGEEPARPICALRKCLSGKGLLVLFLDMTPEGILNNEIFRSLAPLAYLFELKCGKGKEEGRLVLRKT